MLRPGSVTDQDQVTGAPMAPESRPRMRTVSFGSLTTLVNDDGATGSSMTWQPTAPPAPPEPGDMPPPVPPPAATDAPPQPAPSAARASASISGGNSLPAIRRRSRVAVM